jgi:hypothetical protein
VLLFANVELEPDIPSGSPLRFDAKPPPEWVDSAARLSEATEPAPSWVSGAVSLVTCEELTYGPGRQNDSVNSAERRKIGSISSHDSKNVKMIHGFFLWER